MNPRKQPKFVNALTAEGIKKELIQSVLDSGYVLLPSGNVTDTFYGNKIPSSHFPLDGFIRYLKGEPFPFTYSPPRVQVSCISDIWDYLRCDHSSRFLNEGRIVFRGQDREYFTKRPVPNPYVANKQGNEVLVIPSFWRKFHEDWSKRFEHEYQSVFTTIFADKFIYHGIQDWERLSEINGARYGIHTMSDLEDFPDQESQEYYRRYTKCKIEGGLNPELALVEQHYGIATCGLDVTFDPSIASFFATHSFSRDDLDIGWFAPNRSHSGAVIYAFVFTWPTFKKTADLHDDVRTFEHLKPLRPKRQQCGLPFFHSWTMNQAITDCHCIFELDCDFDLSGVPNYRYLFPLEDEDGFYKTAMKLGDFLPEDYGNFQRYRSEQAS